LSTDVPLQMMELSQELKSLREQRDFSNKEAERWAEERDKIHKQIKDLRIEAATLRERRDKANAKVKTLRDQTKKGKTPVFEHEET